MEMLVELQGSNRREGGQKSDFREGKASNKKAFFIIELYNYILTFAKW